MALRKQTNQLSTWAALEQQRRQKLVQLRIITNINICQRTKPTTGVDSSYDNRDHHLHQPNNINIFPRPSTFHRQRTNFVICGV